MKIAVRAIIIHQQRIFLVKHKGRDFYSLPGGKVDSEEGIRSALRRELHEELGVSARIGKMLFVHEFRYPKGDLSLEFFFQVENAADFVGELKGDFAEAELAEMRWVDIGEDIHIMPRFLLQAITRIDSDTMIEYHSELD